MSEEKNNKKINRDVFKWIIIGLVGFVVVVLIFSAGMFVGGTKARFSYHWAESYHKNFGGPRGGFFSDFSRGFGDKDFINAHGTFGLILKIDGNTIIVKGQDDVEKIILVSDNTVIQKGRKTIKLSGLKINENIVIIGSPNDQGQIEAKLIRVFNQELRIRN